MTNQYEGLGLSELMDLMHPLVEPEPVAWLPQTVGWWIVAGWAIGVTTLATCHWYVRRVRNRYRREAEMELNAIARQSDADPLWTAAAIAALLKRTALSGFPRDQVASLTGSDWAGFLTRTANNDALVAAAAGPLSEAAYRPDADGRSLIDAARRWIRVHRV